jgi:hypothetical protein
MEFLVDEEDEDSQKSVNLTTNMVSMANAIDIDNRSIK